MDATELPWLMRIIHPLPSAWNAVNQEKTSVIFAVYFMEVKQDVKDGDNCGVTSSSVRYTAAGWRNKGVKKKGRKARQRIVKREKKGRGCPIHLPAPDTRSMLSKAFTFLSLSVSFLFVRRRPLTHTHTHRDFYTLRCLPLGICAGELPHNCFSESRDWRLFLICCAFLKAAMNRKLPQTNTDQTTSHQERIDDKGVKHTVRWPKPVH